MDKGIFENSFPSQQLCKFYDHHVIPYSLTTRRHDLNWLEYGCASGNALSFLIQRDSLIKTLYLVDVSYSITKNAFENISRSIERVMKFNELIPHYCKLQLPENSIDIINAESSLYYNDFDDLRGNVNDIYRILRPGGVCRYVLKTDKDRYAREEWRISKYSYRVSEPNHWEDGMTITCLPYSSLKDLFGMYSKVHIGREEYTYIDLVNTKSFWIITAYK